MVLRRERVYSSKESLIYEADKQRLTIFKKNNLKRVLGSLWSLMALRGQDLSERTGLSPAGISKIIRNLITKGLVYEDRVVKRRKGRRAISLKINPDSMYAVGIRFARNYIKCGFFNAKG